MKLDSRSEHDKNDQDTTKQYRRSMGRCNVNGASPPVKDRISFD